MNKINILFVLGTRPEIIKLAPLIRLIENSDDFHFRILHTGQHYDYEMSKSFFECINLPSPDVNLDCGGKTDSKQLSLMLEKLENYVNEFNPDIIMAVGDTNSVLAAGITSSRMKIPFGHIEAGIRSFDNTMPEEINRKIAGVTASWHFAPSKNAVINLVREGISPDRIFLTGNTIVDATLQHLEIAKKDYSSEVKEILEKLDNKSIIICTFHRQSNVDNSYKLNEIITFFEKLQGFNIIYPIHPRSLKNVKKYGFYKRLMGIPHLTLTKPLDYLSFLYLLNVSELIITDSGGIQEEAITLKKPCITVRTNTERPETIEIGLNVLTHTDHKEMLEKVRKYKEKGVVNQLYTNPYGDGNASQMILEKIRNNIQNIHFEETDTVHLQGKLIFRLHTVEETISKKELEKKLKAKIVIIYDISGNPIYHVDRLEKGFNVEISYV